MRDNLNISMDEQVVDAASTDENGSAVYVGGLALSQGRPVVADIRVGVDFDTLTSVIFKIQGSATSAFSSATDLYTSSAVLLADLVAGYRHPVRFVPPSDLAYLRVVVATTGTNVAGTICAEFLPYDVVAEDLPFKDGLYFTPRNTSGAAATANA